MREELTVAHAAARAQTTRVTIYRWIRENQVGWTLTPTGQYRVFADTLPHTGRTTTKILSRVVDAP